MQKVERFGRDLAAVLGLPVIVDEPGSNYANIAIQIDANASLIVWQGYGAVAYKVTLSVYVKGMGKLSNYDIQELPRAGFDMSRPIEQIAKSVVTRLIEPAKPIIANMRIKLAKRDAENAEMVALAADMVAKFPGMSIKVDENALYGSFNFVANDCYMNGSIEADGRIIVQRLSVATVEQSNALLNLIAGK